MRWRKGRIWICEYTEDTEKWREKTAATAATVAAVAAAAAAAGASAEGVWKLSLMDGYQSREEGKLI